MQLYWESVNSFATTHGALLLYTVFYHKFSSEIGLNIDAKKIKISSVTSKLEPEYGLNGYQFVENQFTEFYWRISQVVHRQCGYTPLWAPL